MSLLNNSKNNHEKVPLKDDSRLITKTNEIEPDFSKGSF